MSELHLILGPAGTGQALQTGQARLQPLPVALATEPSSPSLAVQALRALGANDDDIARILARRTHQPPAAGIQLHGWQAIPVTDNSTTDGSTPGGKPAGKAVILCFSQHGNTEAAAYLIQKLTNLDVVPLKPVQLYPRDHKAASEQVRIENELGYLPKLNSLPITLADIDQIFLGFPTWDNQLPPPVRSWLSAQAQALADKTILPFTTHAGTGAGESFAQIARLCPDADVRPGLALQGATPADNGALVIRGRQQAIAERELAAWLAQSAFSGL